MGSEEPLVISEWYRRKLGIEKTQISVDLDVKPTCWWIWAAIRAGWHHPDAIVRMATWLAVISCSLGFLSLALALWAACNLLKS